MGTALFVSPGWRSIALKVVEALKSDSIGFCVFLEMFGETATLFSSNLAENINAGPDPLFMPRD